MFGAHTPARIPLPLEKAEMICAWPRLTSCMSSRFRPHLPRQASEAYSPVELVVSSSCWPFSEAGLALILSMSFLRATTALPADSSLVMPMVRMLKRWAPSTAGAEPVPPTSHDLAAAAATCGAPAAKVENSGCRPTSFHQPFSVAMKYGADQ